MARRSSVKQELRFTAVAAVYTAFVALVVYVWPGLLWIKPALTPTGIVMGIGSILAVMAAMNVASVGWAACVTYIARKRFWEARTCNLAGNLPGLIGMGLITYGLLFNDQHFSSNHFSTVETLLILSGFYSGGLSQRLTFPQGADQHFLTSLST